MNIIESMELIVIFLFLAIASLYTSRLQQEECSLYYLILLFFLEMLLISIYLTML